MDGDHSSVDLENLKAIIPINSLNLEAPIPHENTISGSVALLWPYSSTDSSIALLLADKDRAHGGQARIVLRGDGAKAVVHNRLSIGDSLLISLGGAVWRSSTSTITTPGRTIEADLVYGRSISLKVGRRSRLCQHVWC